MKPRTIILISAPRCGTSATYRIFNKHPDVYALFEPNFWNLAVYALEGRPEKFIRRLNNDHPFLDMPNVFTEETVFQLWDTILRKYGPVVFEKSPFYLGDRKAINLLKKYRDLGNDVRLFALIRDPRDAIASQHELWGSSKKRSSIIKREARWLDRFDHLKEIKEAFGDIPIFRYEDLSKTPEYYVPLIFRHCDLKNIPETYNHIKPTSIGRYIYSINYHVRHWKMSYAFKKLLIKYGYGKTKENCIVRLISFTKMLPGNIKREILSAKKRRRQIIRKKQRGLLT